MKNLSLIILLIGSLSVVSAPETKTAAGVLKEFLASVSSGNPKRAASFFAENGHLEAPYVASFGMPSKFEGPDAIAASMTGLFKVAPNFRFTSVKIVMETPAQVVAEYESEATLTNGRQYNMSYICHLTTKDGKIVSYREYLNTVPFVEAFFPNGLKDLIPNPNQK